MAPPKAGVRTVVPSGHALSMVRSWMNLPEDGGDPSTSDAAGDDSGAGAPEDVAPVELESRPLRLGLGAKFLSHNRALQAHTAPVERKLAAKLNQYKDKSTPGEGLPGLRGKGQSAVPLTGKQRWLQKQQQQAGSKRFVKGGDSSESDSEGEGRGGRAASFTKSMVAASSHKAKQADLLKTVPQGKKKRKLGVK